MIIGRSFLLFKEKERNTRRLEGCSWSEAVSEFTHGTEPRPLNSGENLPPLAYIDK